MKLASIPPESDGVGVWHEVHNRVQLDLQHIVANLGTGHPKGSPEQLVSDFYASFTDLPRLAAVGNEQLLSLVDSLTNFNTTRGLSGKLGVLMKLQIDSVFNFSAASDRYIPDRKLPRFSPGGIGLPTPNFYTDPAYSEILRQYVNHLTNLGKIVGLPDAAKAAENSVLFETKLANLRLETNQEDQYHPIRLNRLQLSSRKIEWMTLLFQLGLKIEHDPEIILTQPQYLAGIQDFFSDSQLDSWRDWMTFRVITGLADYGSPELAAAHFTFIDQVLGGLAQVRPRNVRVLDQIEFYLGDAIGQLYSKRHFSENSKNAITSIVTNIVTEYSETLRSLFWMTTPTRAAAMEKLKLLKVKIGHPRWWQDYSDLDIRPDDLFGNAIRAAEFVTKTSLDSVEGNETGEDWQVPPQVVNAYYEQAKNEIVLPAAFLHPPFFDANNDDAENYGAIGSIIAHEISHAFDAKGSMFDGYGRFREWWTPSDRERYELVRKRFSAQLSKLTSPVFPDIHLNGDLCSDEAMSDLGGLAVAYRAWRRTKPDDTTLDQGATPRQRFFLSYASIWRRKEVLAETSFRLASDPHPPNEVRCNFTLSQFAPFHETFQVKPGDGMWLRPSKRLQLW